MLKDRKKGLENDLTFTVAIYVFTYIQIKVTNLK